MRGPHYDRRNGWEGLIKALDLFCDLRDHRTISIRYSLGIDSFAPAIVVYCDALAREAPEDKQRGSDDGKGHAQESCPDQTLLPGLPMMPPKVSFSTKSRSSLALGFLSGISSDLSPAIPATRTEVSTTPLGRFLF